MSFCLTPVVNELELLIIRYKQTGGPVKLSHNSPLGTECPTIDVSASAADAELTRLRVSWLSPMEKALGELPVFVPRPSEAERLAKMPRKCRRSEYRRDTSQTNHGWKFQGLYPFGRRVPSEFFALKEGLTELELDLVEQAQIQSESENAWHSHYQELFRQDIEDWFDHPGLYESTEPSRYYADDYDCPDDSSFYGIYTDGWFD